MRIAIVILATTINNRISKML